MSKRRGSVSDRLFWRSFSSSSSCATGTVSNMNILELEGVTKIYRRSHLGRVRETVGIRNLSLSVKAGEVFGLLGLNGSGKTTTIKLLLGLLRPSSGTVRVLGKAMTDLTVLRQVGYLPEAAYLNRSLTGREVVALFATLSGLSVSNRNQAVPQILRQVGMEEAADRKISDYSKGMLQRIGIAQALVHEPQLLVFDEPITGLDPLAVKEMRQLVSWLKSQGKTVFLSSHDISEVEKVCDRIAILASGELAALAEQKDWQGKEGRLEELFTSTVKRSEAIGALRFT